MGNRDSRFLTSTLMAGCMLLGWEPARAGSMSSPSDPAPPAQTQRIEPCDAIKRHYADLARQFANQARQIASAADDAERLAPAQYIPTRRWQSEYDRALLLNNQSVEIHRLGDTAFQSCSEAALAAQPQRPSTHGRELPRSEAYQPRRTLPAPFEAH